MKKSFFPVNERSECEIIEKWGTTLSVNYIVKSTSDNKGSSIKEIEIKNIFDRNNQIDMKITPTRAKKLQKVLLQKEIYSLQSKTLRLQEKIIRSKKLNAKKKLSPKKAASLREKILHS